MATDVSYFEVEGDSTLYQFNDPDAETALTALNQRLQTAEGNISTLQDDVTTLDESVTDVQGDVSTLQGDVSTAQGDISTLQGDVGTAQGDISDLQGDVAELRTLPVTQTSGNWTWWEFESGLIIGHFYVPSITANMSQAAGSSFRTSAAVTVETPPFSFRYGSTAILPGGQVVWPVNIATLASAISCFFVATVSGQRSFPVSGIFVGVK